MVESSLRQNAATSTPQTCATRNFRSQQKRMRV